MPLAALDLLALPRQLRDRIYSLPLATKAAGYVFGKDVREECFWEPEQLEDAFTLRLFHLRGDAAWDA